jgi:hypothetical protein
MKSPSIRIAARRLSLTALAALTLACAAPAKASCFYGGKFDARTSIAQEFRDSRWVVRAKVIAASDHWSDDKDSWTTYDLAVLDTFKGKLPSRIRFFTTRDSGGFYMDQGLRHDIGGEYLLFLWARPNRKDLPPEAKGAFFVNYNCGLSGPWAKVTAVDRQRLNAAWRAHSSTLIQ